MSIIVPIHDAPVTLQRCLASLDRYASKSEIILVDDSSPNYAGDRYPYLRFICLEVAENLPPEAAEGFIDSLTRLAPVVLCSAAIPFQVGNQHLNGQWPDYWATLFRRHNYVAIARKLASPQYGVRKALRILVRSLRSAV